MELLEETSTQTTLLNVECKEITPDWVDPKQPLKVPVNPLHYYAHKLQILLARLDVQAKNNPAQFNSKSYIDTLNAYTKCITGINEGKTVDEVLDEEGVGQGLPEPGRAPLLGNKASNGLDSRIPADDPFAG